MRRRPIDPYAAKNCRVACTNAVAEGLNSKVATIQKRACGYRNPERFKIAVYFHCGGLRLWPSRFSH
jgi:transposase